jgi:hypothetical protein
VAVANQEAIWKAADELDAAGVRPTLAAIRKRLGAGSFTTISQAMAEWRRRKEKDDRPVVEPLPTGLLNAAHEMVAEIWRAARLAADQAFVGEREKLLADVNAAQEQAQEAVELADTLTADLEIARKELATAPEVAAERDRLAASLQQLEQRSAADVRNAEENAAHRDAMLKEAMASERTALERAARAEGQIEVLQSQLAQVTAALASQKPGSKS